MKKLNLVNLFNAPALPISVLLVSLLPAEVIAQRSNFSTDVIDVSERQLYPNYWLNKLPSERNPLMSQAEIANFNADLITNNIYIFDPLAMPSQLTRAELLAKIKQISTASSSPRVNDNGKHLGKADYANYAAMTNQAAVEASNKIVFGLVVKRSVLRTFPTPDRIFKSSNDRDLDRFQESGLFLGDAVAILHISKDGQWFLVQAYNYLGWMPKGDVAIGNKAEIARFKNDNNFLVVAGAKAFTNYVPNHPELSKVPLEMGTRLPLAKRSEYANQLYGQNPFANYVVKLPVKNAQGELAFALAPIPRSQDVSRGYLPFTKTNLVKQSFKFLGERYGWGHDYNARDCTGFIGEIYKSFGLIMPRNSEQQGKSDYGVNRFFAKERVKADKLKTITAMQTGDLIYIPDHVMMYLGQDNGKPYVIHDVNGLGYVNSQGEIYRGTLNGVSVTPLLPLQHSKSISYVDSIYNIKRIRAQ